MGLFSTIAVGLYRGATYNSYKSRARRDHYHPKHGIEGLISWGPKVGTCFKCDGDGYVTLECNACEGQGDHTYAEQECSACKGAGEHTYPDLNCRVCHGTAVRRYTNTRHDGSSYIKEKPCKCCNATGIYRSGRTTTCTKCGGSGIFKPERTVSCRKCNGSGVFQPTCNKCGGSGDY